MSEPRDSDEPDGKGARRPLREDIRDIDRNILRLLCRRHNLLERIKQHGRLKPEEEKFLREAWQSSVQRVSKDPELAGRFFTMLQGLKFNSRFGDENIEESDNPPFNLAPSSRPVQIRIKAPLDTNPVRSWLYLAACKGTQLEISSVPQSDNLVNFVLILKQLGAMVSRRGEHLSMAAQPPLAAPDRVIHVGSSHFNLFLLLAHYLGRPSRLKITGDPKLRLADLSGLGKFLPQLGARLIHLVPHTSGLPIRLETSGLLPQIANFPEDLPWKLAEAFLLASPFYPSPFALDISTHPQRDTIVAHVVPIFTACGVRHQIEGGLVAVGPGIGDMPDTPAIPMDCHIASVILGITSLIGGHCILDGLWPDWPESRYLEALLREVDLAWPHDSQKITCDASQRLNSFMLDSVPPHLLEQGSVWRPLMAGMAAAVKLGNGQASFPPQWLGHQLTADFFHYATLDFEANGVIVSPATQAPLVWNAPTPYWAMAMAQAACGRKGLQLQNPGIMSELWPGFWAFYNGLPTPQPKTPPAHQSTPVKRRRILTSSIAVPREIKSDTEEL